VAVGTKKPNNRLYWGQPLGALKGNHEHRRAIGLLARTVEEQAAFSQESDAQSRERDARLERRIEGSMLSHELLADDLKSLSVLVNDIGVGTARLLRAIE
jgi:hypothetical protein